LDLKWAKRPLLDMPTWLANIPMVTPAKPEVLKRFRPASRIRSRVARPVWFIASYYSTTDHPSQCFDSNWRSHRPKIANTLARISPTLKR
jgi:hypothetical protein